MNLKIILAIIGIIVSLASFGEMCAQHIVCDTTGKVYPTPCAFDAAKQQDSSLQLAPCPLN